MELCDFGHEQIAYTCNSCHVCELQVKVTALEEEVESLKSDIEEARERETGE